MRIKNSVLNISAGLGSQVIITLLSFISRTVFIYYLGIEYLGINGLFTNVLGMLSLAEAGIGSAIIYNLYKPVAENNTSKIRALMNFYKKAYTSIAITVFILGLLVIPFLNLITNDSSVENIYVIYFIFLLNTSASYLFSYKISFLNVNQKGYIVTGFYSISSVLGTFIKIAILISTKNYILFLIVELFLTIITSWVLTLVVNKKYPYLVGKSEDKLDQKTKENIVQNVKALILHNIGGFAVFGTDNLLIATFISVSAVGLYSNYYMILNIGRTFINQIFDNINHSIGNLVASEKDEKIFLMFKVTMFSNFWIYSFFSIYFFVILEPVISVWLGNNFIMEKSVLIILLLNFFISGMRKSISLYKTTSGIFHADRYAPFVEALINLGASIILVRYLGITGIFIGTLISTLAVPFWIAPYLVYKNVFKIPPVYYFIRYGLYFSLGLATCLLTSYCASLVPFTGVLELVVKSIICFTLVNIVFTFVFFKTKEFEYLSLVVKHITFPLKKKILIKKKLSA